MAFVLFAAGGRFAGGDLYARRLAATLGAKVVPVAGSARGADEAACASVRAAWEALEPDARPLISGLVLSAFVPLAGLLAMRRWAILMDEPQASGEEMLASASQIVASSAAAAEAIAARAALASERVFVVEPPTPALARAPGSGGDGAVILTQGELATEEACAVLFRALAGLADLNWRLCIAGPATEQTADAAALAALTQRFDLTGRINCEIRAPSQCDEALWDEAQWDDTVWRESDLFASAAVGRGYGLATAQAMKRGLPMVIVGDAKSAPEIPAEAGAVAPAGDHAQLAKALRRLIFDRELRSLMADAAWQAGQKLPTDRDVRERLLAVLG